eukprot:10095205-Heterocapsa_arctica.AAC.1
MVRVLRDFSRRRISPASKQRRAAVKRTSSARNVPGKVVGWELQANTLSRLDARPNKHRRRLIVSQTRYKVELSDRTA